MIVITAFYLLDGPGRAESPSVVAYGRNTDFHRYGAALWSTGMKYEYHFRPIGDKRRVFCIHRSPLRIVLPSPAAIGDFVWTWYNECIVTERVLSLFERAGFSGFIADRTEIARFKRRSKGTHEVPPLFEILVYGEGGPPDAQSGSEPLTQSNETGDRQYSSYKNGLIVNEKAWDGSDFFTLEGWRRHTIVSDRVKELIVAEGLSNCLLLPVEGLRWWTNLLTPEEELRRRQAREEGLDLGGTRPP